MSKFMWVILVLITTTFAQNKKLSLTQRVSETTEKMTVGAYNINQLAGVIKWNAQSGHIREWLGCMTYPARKATVNYADGIVWGGYVLDGRTDIPSLRVGGQTYHSGTVPGAIISPGNSQNPDDPGVKIYRIRKDYESMSQSAIRLDASDVFNMDSSEITTDHIALIKTWYERDWKEWPVHLGAPFHDLNSNNIYEPELGETPGLVNADQVIWFVVNDLEEVVTYWFYGSPPMGIELQVTIWGYNRPGPLELATFRRYRMYNKSAFVIDSMYIGLWTDSDLGDYTDDLLGFDHELDMAYIYNGYIRDRSYDTLNLAPPAFGNCLLQGPVVPSQGEMAIFDFKQLNDYKNMPLIAFLPKGSGSAISDPLLGNYDGTLCWYNMLRGYIPTTDIKNPYSYIRGAGPEKGKPTKFPLDGDPVRRTGDVDGKEWNLPPGDRRYAMSTGPIVLKPDERQEFIFAQVVGQGSSHLSSIIALRFNTRYIKYAYKSNFNIPSVVPKPVVNASSLNNKIVIDWGIDQVAIKQIERPDNQSDFDFEGYRVWQLPLESDDLKQGMVIATIDKKSPPGAIRSFKYNDEYGEYFSYTSINGQNTGIQHHFVVTKDFLNDKRLIDGKSYKFAVTAYRYSPDEDNPIPVIESEPAFAGLIAHTGNPGYKSVIGDTLNIRHISGISTAEVTPVVINPGRTTDHSYQVTFTDKLHYSVRDMSSGELKLVQEFLYPDKSDFPVIDGVQLIVNTEIDSSQAAIKYSGKNWAQSMSQQIGQYTEFGSTIDERDLLPVKLEFQDSASVAENGFFSQGAVYRIDKDLKYYGQGSLPIAAYDISDPENPHRSNICFTENSSVETAPANNLWDMGWNGNKFIGTVGANEYLYIMISDYDQGTIYNDQNRGFSADVLYELKLNASGKTTYLNNGFAIELNRHIALTTNDIFEFDAPGEPDVPNRFKLYQNYPNPFNAGTQIRYWLYRNSKVQLEVFNLIGQKVATLVNKDQEKGEYILKWNPDNIASGIYILALISGDYIEQRKMLYLK